MDHVYHPTKLRSASLLQQPSGDRKLGRKTAVHIKDTIFGCAATLKSCKTGQLDPVLLVTDDGLVSPIRRTEKPPDYARSTCTLGGGNMHQSSLTKTPAGGNIYHTIRPRLPSVDECSSMEESRRLAMSSNMKSPCRRVLPITSTALCTSTTSKYQPT